MKLIFDNLRKTKWKNPIPKLKANLAELNQIFLKKFEGEIDEENFVRH